MPGPASGLTASENVLPSASRSHVMFRKEARPSLAQPRPETPPAKPKWLPVRGAEMAMFGMLPLTYWYRGPEVWHYCASGCRKLPWSCCSVVFDVPIARPCFSVGYRLLVSASNLRTVMWAASVHPELNPSARILFQNRLRQSAV